MQASVAVIGSGISGLTAAYEMRETHQVTVYEVEPRLGGHTHTHNIADPDGRNYPVDSGFIVHNDRTYPLLRQLFRDLNIEVYPTEMSMSISCQGCGLEFAGGRGLKGLLANPKQLADRRFRSLLLSVKRFNTAAKAFLGTQDASGVDDLTPLSEWLEREGFNEYFAQHYAVPVVSCVWSSGHELAMQYPARYLFQFLEHHGLLSLTDSPQWYTVIGGSKTYVDAIAQRLTDIRTGDPVVGVLRGQGPQGNQVLIRTESGSEKLVDHVIIATHADQALEMLDDPSADEDHVLGSFGYSDNHTLLHTDESLLPTAKQARSSWNYAMTGCDEMAEGARVTYWMNRLQGHASSRQYLVTLNGSDQVDPSQVLAEMNYTHPEYTPKSVAASRHLDELNTESTAFAGAYHGWGFHEDGCRSGHAAAVWTKGRTRSKAPA